MPTLKEFRDLDAKIEADQLAISQAVIAITTALMDKNAKAKDYSQKVAETIVDAIVRLTRVG